VAAGWQIRPVPQRSIGATISSGPAAKAMTTTSLPLTSKTGAAPHRRPSLSLLASEPARATYEALQALNLWRKTPAQVGQGHTVVLFPGLGADSLSMWPLRRHLERAGFRALDWGQGVNRGPQGNVDAWLDQLAEAIHQRVGPAKQASLVGWSLGGFYARELAKRLPERVPHVITIGTPFSGGPEDTNVGWLFRLLNGRRADEHRALRERFAEPPPVPTISLYSRRDGVVSWEACKHTSSWPLARDIEVSASHIGMGWSPEVMTRVTALLAIRKSAAQATVTATDKITAAETAA
jgi:dienelactone hydrolase